MRTSLSLLTVGIAVTQLYRLGITSDDPYKHQEAIMAKGTSDLEQSLISWPQSSGACSSLWVERLSSLASFAIFMRRV